MRDGAPKTIYRKDYQPPAFAVDTADLRFDIHEGFTLVTSRLALRRQHPGGGLELDGEGLTLETIAIDGRALGDDEFVYDGSTLKIPSVADSLELQTRVRISPEENTSLEGLYRSRTIYCTQCEAEGFRRITFFPDRPDVLAVFTVTVAADAESCPVLLSNGNRVSGKTLEGGRHEAVWHDPWPKPCYLFALVAGDLARVEDGFKTASGRHVDLHMYVEAKDASYCGHALDSLKRSMRWDEQVYDLEYDLDLFNIVAVDDFNMGAMENKSLNVFNTSCVLADPNITTDVGYQRIEAIVAHEYFHNYSGNRVTCRDWFQLSLKEGFTVFRDAEFSADMNSRGVKRVEDVAFLRTHQFAEDAGPMAHPVRPDSFIEISNFYTLTVYEKGAEVVRMLHTLLGHDTFIAGAREYFSRYDGQAVTCDDFVSAMESASGRDLAQFRRWYQQAGTPRLTVAEDYDPATECLTLRITQENPAADDGVENPPLHIPLAVGLLVDGAPMLIAEDSTTRLLEVTDREQSFEFAGVQSQPVVSLLRGFSAPVRVTSSDDADTLQALIAGDDDDFVRWDAFQRYAARLMSSDSAAPDAGFFDAYERVLASDTDPAMKALLLTLPGEEYLADLAAAEGLVDVFAIREAREHLKQQIATRFESQWLSIYEQHRVREAYAAEGAQIGRRSLSGLALEYLCYQDSHRSALPNALLAEADNLTDRLAGLRQVSRWGTPAERAAALGEFYDRWQDEALVVNQWFTLQALRPDGSVIEDVQGLLEHPAFDWRNPNKVRAVIGAFASGNPIGFHRTDGEGYRVLADAIIRLQAANPQIASRLCGPLTKYRRYAKGVEQMRAELDRIAAVDDLSQDVFEVVQRSLEA